MAHVPTPTLPSDTRVQDERLSALAATRWRISIALSLAMIALYFGFIALIAYNRPLLAKRIAPGLTLGILFGASVIAISWLLTYVYVKWANDHYDVELRALSQVPDSARGKP